MSCLTWILNSFRCLCRSPTNCWTRLNSASRGPVVAEVSLLTFPAYLLDAWSFCRSTTRSCSNLAFSATVSSSFWKRERRGEKIIPRSWHAPVIVVIVVVVRQAKVDDTSKTEIYLFLCFSFIYLEEYRLYLETMNGTIKSNFFLRTISLLFIYIYILFREENPDYFSLWKKFFILLEEWNERKVLDWIRVSLNSSDRKYTRNRFNFYPTPLARRLKFLGREFFFHKTRLYFNRPIKNDSDSSYLRVVRQQHPHSAQLFFQQKLLLPVSLRLRQIAPASLQFVPEAA